MGCLGCNEDEEEEGRHHKRRSCTDVLCLTLFGLVWLGFLCMGAFALIVGDPLRLIYGTDSFGNVCGRDNSAKRDPNVQYSGLDLSDRPYVFFLNTSNLRKSLKICIKSCPTTVHNNVGDLSLHFQRTGNNLCRYDYQFDVSTNPDQTNRLNEDAGKGVGPCPAFPVQKSRPILNRCIPQDIYGLGKTLAGGLYDYFNSVDLFRQVIGDLMVSWREIVIMSAASVLITLAVVFLIHFVASLIAWILLIVVSCSMMALTGLMWWTYHEMKTKSNYEMSRFSDVLSETWRNEKTFLALAIIVTIVTIILVLICLVMRKRVELVVALFDESAHCIRSMPGILFQPFWTFVVMILFLLLWLVIVVSMANADYGDTKQTPLSASGRRPTTSSTGGLAFGQSDVSVLETVHTTRPSWVRYMWWYAIIMFLWNLEFIVGCQQMVIAGAVANWYFCRKHSQLICPVGRSIKQLFCYHMGTVALGSFLITLLQIPRIMIAYLTEKAKEHEDWMVCRGLLYCCSCCLWCLERMLQYLTRNAYSITAMKGTAYCSSASTAFSTIASNALRVATINSVGDFILFLGKCAVTAITAICATLLLKHVQNLNFYAVPLIMISIIAFFVAHCILAVYEMVIDTLFMCFCLDMSDNDGSPGKEYHAPPSLMEFMNKHSSSGDSGGGDSAHAMQPMAVQRSKEADV